IDRAQTIYYTNLLISNVIQFCAKIVWIVTTGRWHHDITVAFYFISKSSVFCCRYSLIGCPLLACIRQIKRSLLVSALVWAFCIITVVPATVFEQFIIPPIFALLPAPLFIVCLAGTIKALRAATSVPTEEKRRTVGTLVLLLFNYCLMMVQIWIVWWLFPWVYVGCIDKLLACLSQWKTGSGYIKIV
uniref:G-protein coupled receptors family 1 profile domain-containing protein n=1 Tax=Pundamilia nyererei TaxID=303518 RepID=A0A3B4G0Y6_9CICH